MKAAHIIVIASFILVSITTSPVFAEMYRYTDESGAVYVTDDPGKIPAHLRPKATSMKEDASTDGYAPSQERYEEMVRNGELQEGDKKSGWLRYEDMTWMDKQMLKARAGTYDLKGNVGKDMAKWIAVGVVTLAVLMYLIFTVVKGGAPRGFIGTVLMVGFGLAMFVMFMRVVDKQQKEVLAKVREMKQMRKDRVQALERMFSEDGSGQLSAEDIKALQGGGLGAPSQ